MKKYQVIERYFGLSRVIATVNCLKIANSIAIDLQKAYKRNGLSHFFVVKEVRK